MSVRGADYVTFDGGIGFSTHGVPVVTFYSFGDVRQVGYAALAQPENEFGTGAGYSTHAEIPQGGFRRSVHAWVGQSERSGLVSVSCTKQMNGVSGTWQVVLRGEYDGFVDQQSTRHGAWSDLLSDGDWCAIDAYVDDKKFALMIGRIDTVSVSISAGPDGAVDITTTISGRDAGSVYEDTSVYFNPYDPAHANPAGVAVAKMLGPDAILNGPPGEIAKQVLTSFTASGPYTQQPTVPAGLFGTAPQAFVDVVGLAVGETRGSVFAASMLSVTSAGSVWEYASSFVVPQFNEMFIDTLFGDIPERNGRSVVLTIRERPFENLTDGVNSPWFQLPPRIVDLSEVKSISVHRGQNRINHLSVVTQLLAGQGADAAALFPPAVDIPSIQRWGLRRQEQRTQHNFGIAGAAGEVSATELRDLMLQWNVLNPYYWQGLIAVARIRPDIRIGSKIVVTGGPIPAHPLITASTDVAFYDPPDTVGRGDCGGATTFYVEAVQWSFQGGEEPQAQTQMMVSRGYPDNLRLAHIQKALQTWTDATGAKIDATGGAGAASIPIDDDTANTIRTKFYA